VELRAALLTPLVQITVLGAQRHSSGNGISELLGARLLALGPYLRPPRNSSPRPRAVERRAALLTPLVQITVLGAQRHSSGNGISELLGARLLALGPWSAG